MAKNSKQPGLNFGQNDTTAQGPVECLGIKFSSNDDRRAYFTEKLREKLKDPAFRKIEGFPVGDDEDILAMSDPPYYTACPNPWITEFITIWTQGRSTDAPYNVTPYAVDVSEGKSDPVYRAHSYHTKVPHLAIVPSILHYTAPGDIILDGFCGSGMTGVAARWCDIAPRDFRSSLETTWKAEGRKPPQWGRRNVLLADLSPAATFTSSNYNLPLNITTFETLAESLLAALREETGWLYATRHNKASNGTISFTVWSDVYACPECSHEIVFYEHALDSDGRVLDEIECPGCGSLIAKNKLILVFSTVYDSAIRKTHESPKRLPTQIKYKCGGKSYTKTPDEGDLEIIRRANELPHPANAPHVQFPDMQMVRVGRMKTTNVTHVHNLFLQRSLHVLSRYFEMLGQVQDISQRNALKMLAQHQFVNASIMNRYRPASSFGNSPLTGVFYVSSLIAEANVVDLLKGSVARISRMAKTKWGTWGRDGLAISTGSTTKLEGVPEGSIDYVFTDPPFGENIYYSDLNYLPESWHKVFTATSQEAIVDRAKDKDVFAYQRLMRDCFAEYFRVLKPGRWMTVVFHNSQNAIWNSIQESLQSAGFVVADVRILDKQQGSFQQLVSGNTVKRDLIISAYKPNGGFEERFQEKAGTEDGVWDFVTSHLRQLPVFVSKDNKSEQVIERQTYLLFDRMVAFHVQRGFPIPISSPEFHAGLRQRFPERDGMYFLPEQVTEYDHKRLEVKEVEQLQLFVSDEKSAIQWVRSQLSKEPMSFKELQPIYMMEAQQVWEKHEQPLELRTILEQNFVEDKGKWCVADSKNEVHLEQIRHRALLKEFQQYFEAKGKLKVVRTEALRAGFKEAWQKKDYTTIVQMAKRVPDAVIQEDPALLMYFDNASLLKGE